MNAFIFFCLLQIKAKKEAHPEDVPDLRLLQRCNTHMIGMCQTMRFGHTGSKSVLQYVLILK